MEPLCIAGRNVQVQCCGKQFGSFSKEFNIELLYDPTNPLLGIFPKELKAGTQTGTCARIFTAASFTAAKGMETTQVYINR